MSWNKVKISELLKQYRIEHRVQNDVIYKQVSILNDGSVVLRGEKIGREIGRKRQFLIDLNKFPKTLIFTRQLLLQGSIGLASSDVHNCIVTENMPMFSVNDTKIDVDYLIQFIKSKQFKNQVERIELTGSAQKSIHEKTFLQLEIPLPSISEQKAIVASLKIKNSKVDAISTELTHQLTLVKQLRQAFLKEAMQGKLVESEKLKGNKGTEETGQQLLERIRKEKQELIKNGKLKKEKPLPPIKPEEIPFEIPEDWVWCRLGDAVFDTEGGKSPNCFHEPAKDTEWGVIKTTAVQEMYFLENENKVLPSNFKVSEQHKVLEGDILITRAGPKNRVGIVCCVENLTKNLILSDKTIRIKHSKKLIQSKFIALALNSPLIKPYIEKKMTGMADSQVNISQSSMKGFPFPLPPLSTQQRIVEKLDQLMSLCDGLESNIKSSKEQNEQLLQEVLREAMEF